MTRILSFVRTVVCMLSVMDFLLYSKNSVNAKNKVDLHTVPSENIDVLEKCIKSNALNNLNTKDDNYPIVLLSIFVDKPTPFFDEFLDKIKNIDYPKSRLILSITTFVEYHKVQVDEFINIIGDQYKASFVFHRTSENKIHARCSSFSLCTSELCDYLFYIESEVHLDNPQTLKILVQQNKKIIAPMLTQPFKTRSNFWGALSKEGFYAGSFDYMDIINHNKTGVWKVSYISSCYLIKDQIVEEKNIRQVFFNDDNLDMALSKSLSEKGVFLYIDNQCYFGHLINSDTFNITLKNPDVYQIFENIYDWKQRYIHSDFIDNFNSDKNFTEPCPEVFLFPIVTERFCQELIEIIENFGQWTVNKTNDIRLGSVFDPVPTRHIYLRQVELHFVWIKFLQHIFYHLLVHVYDGYDESDLICPMNFVVKHNPFDQFSLKDHCNKFPLIITIALNSPVKDYQGGGCYFFRQKCKVDDMKVGWILMHPGKLTHYYEDLEVTSGTRYSMVSFIDMN